MLYTIVRTLWILLPEVWSSTDIKNMSIKSLNKKQQQKALYNEYPEFWQDKQRFLTYCVNSILSIIWHACEMGCAITEILLVASETQYIVRTTGFCLNSCVVILISDIIMDLWAKDFTYIHCNVITDSVSVYHNGTCVRDDDGQCC